jgi:hypothetical protein
VKQLELEWASRGDLELLERMRRQPEHPLRSTDDAHRSINHSARSKSLTIAHRATMATTMGLPQLSKLAVITTIILPQDSSHHDNGIK